jgi:hypothetical protein
LVHRIFVIAEAFKNNPPHYHLKDMKGKEKGKFYEQELMK